jgi:hypothetical protein
MKKYLITAITALSLGAFTVPASASAPVQDISTKHSNTLAAVYYVDGPGWGYRSYRPYRYYSSGYYSDCDGCYYRYYRGHRHHHRVHGYHHRGHGYHHRHHHHHRHHNRR